MFYPYDSVEECMQRHENLPISSRMKSFFNAVNSGNVTCVDFLLRQGIDINAKDYNLLTALYLAVKSNNNLMVSFLILRGADPNITCGINHETPVTLAAKENKVSILHYLIQHNGNDYYCDSNNVSILSYAVAASATLSTEYLV